MTAPATIVTHLHIKDHLVCFIWIFKSALITHSRESVYTFVQISVLTTHVAVSYITARNTDLDDKDICVKVLYLELFCAK